MSESNEPDDTISSSSSPPPLKDIEDDDDDAKNDKKNEKNDAKNKKNKEEKEDDDEEEEMVMHRQVIQSTYEYDEHVALIEYEGVSECNGAILIEGFATQTLTSMLASGFIADQLKLPLIGCITAPSIPGKVIIQNGVAMHPIRILGNKHIIVICCEFQIVSPDMNHYISKAILDFCKRHACPLFITMEGMPTPPQEMKDKDDVKRIRYITTDLTFSKWLKERKHIPIQNAIIPGFTGNLLTNASTDSQINIAALLVKSNQRIPDSNSAVVLVRMLDEYLVDLNLNTNELEKKSKELENQVKELLQKYGDAAAQTRKGPESMYM